MDKSDNLQISRANAVKAYQGANDKGKALLANLLGEEVFNTPVHFTDIDQFEAACEFLGDNDKSVKAYNLLKDLEGLPDDILAYAELRVVAKAMNGGLVMNYNNTNEAKNYPWFNAQGSGAGFSFNVVVCDSSHSDVGSRLCMIDGARARHAGAKFLSIYDRFINAEED